MTSYIWNPLEGGDRLARSSAALGDIDGDGIPDVAVGSSRDGDGAKSGGAVYILHLNRDGTVKNLDCAGPNGPNKCVFEPPQSTSCFDSSKKESPNIAACSDPEFLDPEISEQRRPRPPADPVKFKINVIYNM